MRLSLRFLLVGAAAAITGTSLCSLASVLRWARGVETYVWIASPLAAGPIGSGIWHATIASVFGGLTIMLWRRRSIQLPVRNVPTTSLAVAAGACMLTALAAKDAVTFYVLLVRGSIRSTAPVPLSLGVAMLLATGLFLLFTKNATRENRPMQFVGNLAATTVGWVGLVLAHLITFGATDYTMPADAAVVLGAKVYPDGTASLALSDRVQTGIDLFRQGHVKYLIMSGATGAEGQNEAAVMRRLALEAGVPESCVLLDDRGVNTSHSARHCARILTEHRLATVLLVSHYYHLARAKMAFAEQGVTCFTVPARMSRRLAKEPYFVLRECAAYAAYCAARPFRASKMVCDKNL